MGKLDYNDLETPAMTALPDDADKCAYIAEMMKALGHPVRLRIVALLCDSEEHVGAIAERLDVSQSSVSQQLSILRARRMVDKRNEGGRAIYQITEPRLRELVTCMQGCEVR